MLNAGSYKNVGYRNKRKGIFFMQLYQIKEKAFIEKHFKLTTSCMNKI